MKEINFKALLNKLPPLTQDSNKYSFGHLVIIGGNLGYPGAVRLSGEAALRSGVGLVSILTRSENICAISSGRPELMVNSFERGSDLLKRADALVIGPGLGRDKWAKKIWDEVKGLETKKVVDADALWWLAQDKLKLENSIITPHLGEASRLVKIKDREREMITKDLVQFCNIVVLKGHETLITNTDETFINRTGNPILATAGTGDILAGMIGAYLAQGLSLTEAACLGVSAHGKAADLFRDKSKSLRGAVASDLFSFIGSVGT